MASGRLILLFLAIILIIVIMLSSGRIAGALRSRFGSIIPGMDKTSSQISQTPTPTPTLKGETNGTLSTVTSAPMKKTTIENKGGPEVISSQPSSEIPATGPGVLSAVLISSGLISGLYFKKISSKK